MFALLSTDPGLQEVAAAELHELEPAAGIDVSPWNATGLLRVETNALDAIAAMRTIHHVVEIRGGGRASSLGDVERVVAETEIPELEHARSFRVTTEHVGSLDVARMKIQGVSGAALVRRYGTSVDLEGFEVNVRVDLHGSHVVVGVQRTRESLGKRLRRARVIRSSLKPTVAAAMIRLAGAHEGGGRLIDPLCGTGTIPIEAAEINPRLEVQACDWDTETVDTARATVSNHGLEIDVRLGDARALDEIYTRRFDYIVTDPPYGVRLGRRTDIRALYAALLEAFERSLVDAGRLVLIVVKFRAFLRALAPTGFEIVDERLVDVGGLHPRIFVLDRR